MTEFGDPSLIALQGGVVIINPADQSVLGGIGVSGLAAEEDEALAKMGLKAVIGDNHSQALQTRGVDASGPAPPVFFPPRLRRPTHQHYLS